MPIRVECPHCGKGIKAPSKFAGKQAKCPACKGMITIPRLQEPAVPPAPPLPASQPSTPAADPLPQSELLPASVPCPFCSEPILPQAKKCKHCGEFIDGATRIQATGPPSPATVAITPPDSVTIKHEHKNKTSFFRVGFGTGCGCLCVVALGLGGCLLTTGYFASEAVVTVADTMDEVEKSIAKAEADRKQQALERSRKLSVDFAEYEKSDDGFSGASLNIRVTNHSSSPVSRIFFHGVLRSPDRAVPWAEDDFNFSIQGGIEPGESKELNLSPGFGSELRSANPDDSATFTVTIVDVEYFE